MLNVTSTCFAFAVKTTWCRQIVCVVPRTLRPFLLSSCIQLRPVQISAPSERVTASGILEELPPPVRTAFASNATASRQYIRPISRPVAVCRSMAAAPPSPRFSTANVSPKPRAHFHRPSLAVPKPFSDPNETSPVVPQGSSEPRKSPSQFAIIVDTLNKGRQGFGLSRTRRDRRELPSLRRQHPRTPAHGAHEINIRHGA